MLKGMMINSELSETCVMKSVAHSNPQMDFITTPMES